MVVPCPLPVIGVVHSARSTPETTPVQAALEPWRRRARWRSSRPSPKVSPASTGSTTPGWSAGCTHRTASDEEPPALTQVPFLLRAEQRQMGIFATRGPAPGEPDRVEPGGTARVYGRHVRFAGVDLLDGTPADRPQAVRDPVRPAGRCSRAAAGSTGCRCPKASPRPSSASRKTRDAPVVRIWGWRAERKAWDRPRRSASRRCPLTSSGRCRRRSTPSSSSC